jgi:hypothetical protein
MVPFVFRLLSVFGAIWALAASPPATAATSGPLDLAALKPAIDCAAMAQADVSAAVGARVTIKSAKVVEGARPYAVRGEIAPKIGFEVRLPSNGWTQRYVQLGCGGLCGNIGIRPNHVDDCTPVTDGSTVLASTDMGHSGMGGGGEWGKDPQARNDFGYRGVHLTALASKALIAHYYGRPARFSYFHGCSDGGREAMVEAQRFPKDFNGIAAGAAVINFQVQNTFYHGWQALSNQRADGSVILKGNKLPALHKAAIENCDRVDGLKDGQISDPRRCRFDPAVAQCKPGEAPSDACLTAEEVGVARKFYEGPHDDAGHRFTIGGPQVGSELSWAGVFVPDAVRNNRMSPGAALDVLKYVAFPQNPPDTYVLKDLHFDVASFNQLEALHPLYDATDTDLSPFQKAGGKLLMWHGWSDPHISPINSIAYYQGVEKVLGDAQTHAFARLFMFPGVYHCGGGDGESEFDVLSPLMAWVERGQAPDRILAGRPVGGARAPGPPPPAAGIPAAMAAGDRGPPDQGPAKMERTRPVYPYPLVARHDGKGSIDQASSFTASRPSAPEPAVYAWEGARFMTPKHSPMTK